MPTATELRDWRMYDNIQQQKAPSLQINNRIPAIQHHSKVSLKGVIDMTSKKVVFIFNANDKIESESAETILLSNTNYSIYALSNESHVTEDLMDITIKAKEWQINDKVVIWNGVARHLKHAYKIASYIAKHSACLIVNFDVIFRNDKSFIEKSLDIESTCKKAFKLSNKRGLRLPPENFKHTTTPEKAAECILIERVKFYIEHFNSQPHNISATKSLEFKTLETIKGTYLQNLHFYDKLPTFN